MARAHTAPGADGFGPLQPVDANGLMLPAGFTSRIVAESRETVAGTSHTWHRDPDGGAVFATGDGAGSTSRTPSASAAAGVGAIRFDANASIVDAYSILTGTTRNCAGGPTPWGTWLSCEEVSSGEVYECDPYAPGSQGQVRPALGTFSHEAAAVDPVYGEIYLTEDHGSGLLYRFTPTPIPRSARARSRPRRSSTRSARGRSRSGRCARSPGTRSPTRPSRRGRRPAIRHRMRPTSTAARAAGTRAGSSTSRPRGITASGASTPRPRRSRSSTTATPRRIPSSRIPTTSTPPRSGTCTWPRIRRAADRRAHAERRRGPGRPAPRTRAAPRSPDRRSTPPAPASTSARSAIPA